MTAPTVATPDYSTRRVPPLGGLNLTVLTLEVKRVLRNKRTIIFSLLLPTVLFLAFGLNSSYVTSKPSPGAHGNTTAFILISMALYGGMLATTTGGARVSLERSAGWSRQLRLTPLSPAAYIIIKLVSSLMLGLVSVAVVNIVGAVTGRPHMSVALWIGSALAVWIGSLVFAAFGLFLGYVLPADNVMQLMGIVLMLLGFLGGLFIPLSSYPQILQDIAHFTPVYGLNQLVHAPLLGDGVHLSWVINAVAWLVIFAGGAAWRFRKDTERV
jgi:ABC-2 type transport system permease protein